MNNDDWYLAIPFWLAIITAIIVLIANPNSIAHAQTSFDHMSTCSANLAVCFNESSSTPGPNGIIRANINDHPVASSPAYDRVIILLHWEPSTLQFPYCVRGYCPVVKAAAGGAYSGGGGAYYCPLNCYIEAKNTDTYDPNFTRWLWWGARIHKDGTFYDAMVGYPSL